MIHCVTPYRTDRNLGKAYNDTFRLIGEDDWLCITDYDVLFPLPDTLSHIHKYVELFPEAGMFVCYANRTYHSNAQLYGGPVNSPTDVNPDPNIINHLKLSREAAKQLYEVTPIERSISGFLMVISKKVWNEIKFAEDLKCLGVDTLYSNKVLQSGRQILRMNGIYVWHTYRLEHGIQDKSHLL